MRISDKNKKNVSISKIFPLFLVISFSCIFIGYAKIGNINLNIGGMIAAQAPENIFITNVNTNGDINAYFDYSGTLLHSIVTLPTENDENGNVTEISYTISFYNNVNIPYVYKGTTTDKTNSDVYSNSEIDYRVEGIEIGEIIVSKEFEITITFFYKDGIIDNNVLDSYIKFNFSNPEWEFDYNDEEKERIFTVPKTGYYQLDAWGAQGGGSSNATGGYGGYSTAIVYLEANTSLYINVGGTTTDGTGGYNGGGSASGTGFGGGGATHIAFAQSGELKTFDKNGDGIGSSNELSNLIIVAGGGGGGDRWGNTASGGAGGGYIGGNIKITGGEITDKGGATQESGGEPYYNDGYTSYAGTFGLGGNGSIEKRYGGAGGGGLYGGGGGGATSQITASGGGGSGYIGNIGYTEMSVSHMTCYDCQIIDGERITTTSSLVASNEPRIDTPKIGNGYVKIKYLDNINVKYNKEFEFSNNEQVFTITQTGTYKLEVWGAQGGSYYSLAGGYGSYSSGNVFLKEGTVLYINVGGTTTNGTGGYNGGGSAGGGGKGGGGATHIALDSGLLTKFESKEDRLLIVAGGGGGVDPWHFDTAGGAGGGSAGGYIGVSGMLTGQIIPYDFGGGTQTSGGIAKFDGEEYTSTNGIFGLGGNGSIETGYGGAGGGGLYGGGGGGAASTWCAGGSGGSGYIGNLIQNTRVMYCYNCEETDEDNIKTISTDKVNSKPISDTAKIGNGYAKITLVSVNE